MEPRNFLSLIQAQWSKNHFVCVGLDTNHDNIPKHLQTNAIGDDIVTFNTAIIDVTKDIVCAYKPNTAFYEAYGAEGIEALKITCDYIRNVAPSVAIILDAKRADIGNTNQGYVEFAYTYLQADAITLHPYLGREALEPFLEMKDKGNIILCRTSNPGAGEFQDLLVKGSPLYRTVAEKVATEWNQHGNCMLVVGGTYPEEIGEVRQVVGDMPFLIPGIGAQGGDIEKTVHAAMDSKKQGMIINSSRGIIYASDGEDFADAARSATVTLHETINEYRR